MCISSGGALWVPDESGPQLRVAILVACDQPAVNADRYISCSPRYLEERKFDEPSVREHLEPKRAVITERHTNRRQRRQGEHVADTRSRQVADTESTQNYKRAVELTQMAREATERNAECATDGGAARAGAPDSRDRLTQQGGDGLHRRAATARAVGSCRRCYPTCRWCGEGHHAADDTWGKQHGLHRRAATAETVGKRPEAT